MPPIRIYHKDGTFARIGKRSEDKAKMAKMLVSVQSIMRNMLAVAKNRSLPDVNENFEPLFSTAFTNADIRAKISRNSFLININAFKSKKYNTFQMSNIGPLLSYGQMLLNLSKKTVSYFLVNNPDAIPLAMLR